MTATAAGQPAMDPEDSGPGGAETVSDAVRFGDTAALGTARPGADQAANADARIAALRDRLMTPMPTDRVWGWIGPLLVTAFAGFLRFYRLSVPNAIVFDETYYAKDAWSILQHGVEYNWATFFPNANTQIVAGHTSFIFHCSGTACAEYVVQPPVGKLLIAVGEWLYGLTSLGWRVAPALLGTLAILVMCRVARRITRSTLLGCLAGLLLSLDGLEFVLSRTGILDIFLMFFVLASFGCLVVDRDVSRARLAEAVVLKSSDDAGPSLGIRKWRVAAGVLIGLACATKQYGLLVRPRVRRPLHRVGHGSAPDRRAPVLRARRAGQGRQVAADHARGHPAGHLHRQLVGLVRHVHRLRPELRPAQRL